jgi:hypothetical protein
MPVEYGPRVVTNGLVLALDAADINSFDEYENLRTNSNTGGFFPVVGSYTFTGTSTDILAPNGSNTTYKVVANGTQQSTIDIAYQQITLTAGETYTVSLYYYATGSTTSSRNLGIQVFGNGSTYTTFTLPQNTWVRQSLTFTASSTSNTGQIRVISNDYASFNSQSGATVYLWGAQLERGSSATDYYATTGTAKTRGSTWIDLSDRGNTGTLTNGPTYNSSNGGSIVFDGTNDYISVSQTLSTPITISSFVRYTDQSKTLNSLINSNPHTVIGISLNRVGGGELYVYIGNGSGWLAAPSIISSSNMLVNTWYQITFTSTGSGSTLYLNGTSVGTSIYSPSGWGSTYYLGALNFGGEYLKGNIATTQIYNRALTASEIQQNFNALRGRFGI